MADSDITLDDVFAELAQYLEPQIRPDEFTLDEFYEAHPERYTNKDQARVELSELEAAGVLTSRMYKRYKYYRMAERDEPTS